MKAKEKRRLALLDDLLDYALRSECHWALCNGPIAPIRHMQTCHRCACIHRGIQMGLVSRCGKTYTRTPRHGGLDILVCEGAIEQFSSIDGERI